MARADIKAGAAYVELYTKNSRFQRGLANARRQMRDFASDIGTLGRSMMTASIVMLTPVALATKRFADFDDKMREVKAVSQSSAEEFERLTQKAKELGRTTSFTAVQVAALMAELGRAGFTADQVDAMTASVLNLARATSTDATMASGIMAAAIREFGLQAGDATRVADALTVAANKSFNTVESLGDSLSYAGPVAADFNMSIEDTLAILGALGNVGIQGSAAGTALRRLLTVTGADAEKLEGIFKVSFRDAAGNARPLVQVLDEVNKATAELGTGERAAKFNEAFGLLGITSASAISKNVVNVQELSDALRDAEGAAASTAAEMDAGLGGVLRILLSATEGVAIKIGEVLEGDGMKFGQWLTEVAGATTQWIEENADLVQSLVKLAAGIGVAGAGFAALGLTAGAVSIALGGIAALFSPLGLVVVALTALAATAVGVHALVTVTADLTREMSNAREEADKLRASDLALFERLEQLANQQSRTSAEMREAAGIIDQLEQRHGDLGLSINSATGEIEGMRGAYGQLLDVMRQQADMEIGREMAEVRKNISEANQALEATNATWRHTLRLFMPGATSGAEGIMNDLTALERQLHKLQQRRNALDAGSAGAITGGATADEAAPASENQQAADQASTNMQRQADAGDAAKRLDELEEEFARKRRTRVEQEIKDIQELAAERRKLLDEAGVFDPAEHFQVEADAAAAIADVRKREDERLAQEATDKLNSEIQQMMDLERVRIEVDPDLSELDKELARLALQFEQEMMQAIDAGLETDSIVEKFELLKAQAGRRDGVDGAKEAVFTTFSAAAAEARGREGVSGTSKEQRTLEEIRDLNRKQHEEMMRQRREAVFK